MSISSGGTLALERQESLYRRMLETITQGLDEHAGVPSTWANGALLLFDGTLWSLL